MSDIPTFGPPTPAPWLQTDGLSGDHRPPPPPPRPEPSWSVVIVLAIAVGIAIAATLLAVDAMAERNAAEDQLEQIVVPTCESLDNVGYDGTASCIDAGGNLVGPGDAAAITAWKRYDGLTAAWELCDRLDFWDQPSCQNEDGTPMTKPVPPAVPRPGS